AIMGGFIVVDTLLGVRVFHVVIPALVAGLVVSYAVLLASRALLWSTVLAAAASIAVSAAVRAAEPTLYSPVMGLGAWPGVAELAGLGLLTGWSVRSLKLEGAAIAVLSVAGALYAMADLRQDGPYRAGVQWLLAVGLAGAVGAGLYLRRIDDKQVQQTLQARHDERLAIARELHDVVAHHVTGIVVQAQAAKLVADLQPEATIPALAAIETAGAEALTAMRRMVGALREEDAAAPIAPAATLDDLRDIAERTTALGLPVRLHIDGDAAEVPGELAMSIHRVVREALTNAQRHAIGATLVDVAVVIRDQSVRVIVRDNGHAGRPSKDRSGFGITGMAERVSALGGRFRAGPLKSGGWQILADLPFAGVTSTMPT
ncbi:MAG TPA: histidine kinase, partial [Ilumatobacteraceae bacterium]|nr:histidine kinase [Ilumatobacteraceae bacterium]